MEKLWVSQSSLRRKVIMRLNIVINTRRRYKQKATVRNEEVDVRLIQGRATSVACSA